MVRCRLAIGVLALAMLITGCEDTGQKPGAQPNASDAAQKSMEHTRDMTGVAPPGGLQ